MNDPGFPVSARSTPPLPEERTPLGPLLAACAVAVLALKLCLLALPPLELSPVHIPGTAPGLPGFEEWRRGMAAEEWLRGPLLPWLDYQQGHFQGGTLVTIGLAALSFRLFGSSPFAMRLPNVLFDIAGVLALVWLVDRAAGRRAARYTALFATLAAPGYWIVGAAAWASHVESNGQACVLLALWARHVFFGARGARSAFGLGLAAGLALWYHYGVALWLAVLFAVELVHAPRRCLSRVFLWRLLGLAVGLVPWLIYNLRYGWAGLGLYGRSAEQHVQFHLSRALAAFRELWVEFLPGSTWIPDLFGVVGSGRVIGHVLVAAAFAAWLHGLRRALNRWRQERAVGPELVFVIQPVVWALAYSFGEFHGDRKWAQGYRYMLAIHPSAWALGGIAFAAWAARSRALARGAALALGSVLLAGFVLVLRPAHLPLAFEAPGRNLESLGRWLFHRRLDSPELLVRAAERLVAEREPLEQDIVLFTLGNTLAYQASAPPPAGASADAVAAHTLAQEQARAASAALAAAVPEAYRPYFLPLAPGERPWPWSQRDGFWRQWDRRGVGRPPGAYRH